MLIIRSGIFGICGGSIVISVVIHRNDNVAPFPVGVVGRLVAAADSPRYRFGIVHRAAHDYIRTPSRRRLYCRFSVDRLQIFSVIAGCLPGVPEKGAVEGAYGSEADGVTDLGHAQLVVTEQNAGS